MTPSTILARAPLPLLALSAAWGVWQFQMLFTPWYVAALSATAFEVVYIALAMESRPAARPIAIAAVAVSVLYNVGAALFHLRPALLIDRPLGADVLLSVAHGLPLAVVAYAVADLLLHQPAQPVPPDEQPEPPALPAVPVLTEERIMVAERRYTWRQLADRTGMPVSTLRRKLAEEVAE